MDMHYVMDEMRALAARAAPSRADVARLFELEACLSELLEASAGRCRELADRLAVLEEHALESGLASVPNSTSAAALASKLGAAGRERASGT